MNPLKHFIYSLFFAAVCCNASNAPTKKDKVKHQESTIKSLEDGFEQIVQYHIEKGELHERTAADVREFTKYLVNQTDYTRKRLKEVIEKINYENIKRNEEYKLWPDIEFWRGVDDFGSSLALNYDGLVDILRDEAPIIIGRYEYEKTLSDEERILVLKKRKSIKIDLEKYPVSLLGYYEYKFDETALFYAWIGYLWQEIEGYKCGIKVRTVQNNSIATFSLNDFLNREFSSFITSSYGEKPPRIENFFPRKLSLVELYQRASQTSYPFNPYKNYWRYFEKGNQFTEIVTYEFSTGIRMGDLSERQTAQLSQVIKHENSRTALEHITKFTNQMIFEGWEEKLRPIDMPTKMYLHAYDFDIWTGVSWTKEQANILPNEQVEAFENEFKIKLPDSFFHYLRLLNGRQYNIHNMHFPINNLYTIRVKKFYNISELRSGAKKTMGGDSKYLWIGELVDERMLGLLVDEQSNLYGRIAIAANEQIEICDYAFEKFAKYAQSSPKQPEIFAAEENDTVFLRKRLNEGWNYNAKYDYQDAINQAAMYNSHEALLILLEAGARLRHNRHRDMPYLYDEKTMEILDRYQTD